MQQKNLPQAKGHCGTSKQGGILSLDEWLVILAEHFSKEISPGNVEIYHRGLRDLSPDTIDGACMSALQACRFMPTLADIRSQLGKLDEVQTDLNAEGEWERALDCAEQYSPDTKATSPQAIDWRGALAWRRQPNLSAAGEYAIRCAGGWAALEKAHFDPADATWRRKAFLEAYKSYHQGEHLGLTEGQTQKLLSKVQEVSKQLGEGK